MDLRSVQKPLKDKYRNEPSSSRITLEAKASQEDTPGLLFRGYRARGLRGSGPRGGGGRRDGRLLRGTSCSGALAACAQVTCQMVAGAMGNRDRAHRGGPWKGRWTSRARFGIFEVIVPVGFERHRYLASIVDAPAEPTGEELDNLRPQDRAVLRRLPDADATAAARDGVGLGERGPARQPVNLYFGAGDARAPVPAGRPW